MRYFFSHLPELTARLRQSQGVVLMLDFDGTLAPIAKTPQQARMPSPVKRQLTACARHFPVAIISGRSLSDVRKKVGLRNLTYAGNHGLEWQMGGRYERVVLSPGMEKALQEANAVCAELRNQFPGVIHEDKGLTVSLHYRALSENARPRFLVHARALVMRLTEKGSLVAKRGKKVIELAPAIEWSKGKFARFLLDQLERIAGKKFLPLYIGDDKTDEDAFRELASGITIRVGRNKKSYAAYYFRETKEVARIFPWLREVRKRTG